MRNLPFAVAPAAPDVRLGGLAPWRIRRLQAFVEEHLSQSIHIADLSGAVGLGVPHSLGLRASPTFATRPRFRKFCSLRGAERALETRGVSQARPAETGCGADQAPCETASGFGRLASCFCATSFAAKTARSTAIGASSRTAGYPAGGRCSDTCCIWARSTTASAPHGARRSRRSTRAGRAANRSRCSPRIVRRRHWIAMWCMSGSAACGCAGRGNGAAAGWRAICGISFSWMSSGRRACRYRDRGHAG